MDHSKTSSTWGGRKVPALTWNTYYFFKIQQNAAKLCDFSKNVSVNNLVGLVVLSGTYHGKGF